MFLLLANRQFAILNSRIHLLKLIKEELGEEVSIYAYPDDHKIEKETNTYKLLPAAKITSLKGAIKYFTRLYWIIKQDSPAVVHAFNPLPIYASGILRYILSFNLVLTITGLGRYYIREREPLRVLFNILYFISFKRADSIIFQNSDDYYYFSGKFPSLKNKMQVIKSGGVSLSRFNYHKEANSTVYNVINISRLLNQKGIEEFYNIVKIYENFQGIHFTLVGEYDKNHPDSIDEVLYTKLRNLDNLDLLPFQSDLSEIYNKANLFLFCSKREGFPRVILEANYFKVPALAYDAVGVRDSIMNFYTGLLISNNDFKSMKNAFDFFYSQPQVLRTFGENARKVVIDQYSEENVYAKYVEVYKTYTTKFD